MSTHALLVHSVPERFEILDAPDEIEISLAMLQQVDAKVMEFHGAEIWIHGYREGSVIPTLWVYEILGLTDNRFSLVCKLGWIS